MPDFGRTFTLPTYPELNDMLKKYLDIGETGSTSLSTNVTANKDAVHSGFDVTPKPKAQDVNIAAQNAVDELEALFSTKFE